MATTIDAARINRTARIDETLHAKAREIGRRQCVRIGGVIGAKAQKLQPRDIGKIGKACSRREKRDEIWKFIANK